MIKYKRHQLNTGGACDKRCTFSFPSYFYRIYTLFVKSMSCGLPVLCFIGSITTICTFLTFIMMINCCYRCYAFVMYITFACGGYCNMLIASKSLVCPWFMIHCTIIANTSAAIKIMLISATRIGKSTTSNDHTYEHDKYEHHRSLHNKQFLSLFVLLSLKSSINSTYVKRDYVFNTFCWLIIRYDLWYTGYDPCKMPSLMAMGARQLILQGFFKFYMPGF